MSKSETKLQNRIWKLKLESVNSQTANLTKSENWRSKIRFGSSNLPFAISKSEFEYQKVTSKLNFKTLTWDFVLKWKGDQQWQTLKDVSWLNCRLELYPCPWTFISESLQNFIASELYLKTLSHQIFITELLSHQIFISELLSHMATCKPVTLHQSSNLNFDHTHNTSLHSWPLHLFSNFSKFSNYLPPDQLFSIFSINSPFSPSILHFLPHTWSRQEWDYFLWLCP